MARSRYQQMAAHLAIRRREGLTFQELSERVGIPATTLSWWSSQIRRRKRAETELVEVEVESSSQSATAGVSILAGGVEVRVMPGFDPAVLRQVVAALCDQC